MPSDESWQKWFERIWEFREETLYRQWFGDTGPGIYCLSADLFAKLGVRNPDPRWLHHGVFACPPAGARPHWAYVTSGLSNPWGQEPGSIDPRQYSGLGLELLILTPQKADWAIGTLSWLSAVILLVACGKIRGPLPELGDRIPLGTPIHPTSAIAQFVLAAPPEPLPGQFQLESGLVDLMLCLGISDAETRFAKANSSDELLEKLRAAGGYPLTDADRRSIL